MNSHNTRPEHAFHKTPPAQADKAGARKVLSATLSEQVELSLDDNSDQGSDPYNSTGQHAILRQRKR